MKSILNLVLVKLRRASTSWFARYSPAAVVPELLHPFRLLQRHERKSIRRSGHQCSTTTKYPCANNLPSREAQIRSGRGRQGAAHALRRPRLEGSSPERYARDRLRPGAWAEACKWIAPWL